MAYRLETKVRALTLLDDTPITAVSEKLQVPVHTLRGWQKDREAIYTEHFSRLRDEANREMLVVQRRLASRANSIINQIDDTRLKDAPLNHLAGALSMMIDRYLKLQHIALQPTQPAEQVIRIEYVESGTHTTTDAPPWAAGDSDASGTVQDRGVRAKVRQNGASEDQHHRTGAEGATLLVAGSHVFHEFASVARDEDGDDAYNWYDD